MTHLCPLRVGVLTAALALGLGAAGCKQAPAEAGETCTRSLQCDKGLACVEGVCSDDLTPLEDPDRIPMLTPPEPEPMAVPDAAAPMPTGGSDAVTPPPPPPAMPMPMPMPMLDASAGG